MTTSDPSSESGRPRSARERARRWARWVGPTRRACRPERLPARSSRPIRRAAAVRHLQSDPEANALADRLVQQLRLIAPKATPSEDPLARGGRAAPSSSPTPRQRRLPVGSPGAARRPGAWFASRVAGALGGLGRTSAAAAYPDHGGAAAGLALVIVAIVLLSGSGDDGAGDSPRRHLSTERRGSRRSN